VAFRFVLANPMAMVPFEFGSMNILVEPHFGLYGFMAATIASLVMSHLLLAVHRRAEAEDGERSRSHSIDRLGELTDSQHELYETPKEALRAHTFLVGRHAVRCTVAGQASVCVLLLGGMIFLWVGAYMNSFHFEFEGAAGLALTLTGQSVDAHYSLFHLASVVSSGVQSGFGIYFMQASFIIFAAGTPIAQILALFVLWCVPLTMKYHHSIFVASEVLGAWAALEVFIVSIVASLLELPQFAAFIIGDKCDQINNVLAGDLPHLFPSQDQAICFNVVSKLDPGCLVLFGSALIATIVGQIVTRSAETALDERSMPGYGDAASRPMSPEGDVEENAGEEGAAQSPVWYIRCLESMGLCQTQLQTGTYRRESTGVPRI